MFNANLKLYALSARTFGGKNNAFCHALSKELTGLFRLCRSLNKYQMHFSLLVMRIDVHFCRIYIIAFRLGETKKGVIDANSVGSACSCLKRQLLFFSFLNTDCVKA